MAGRRSALRSRLIGEKAGSTVSVFCMGVLLDKVELVSVWSVVADSCDTCGDVVLIGFLLLCKSADLVFCVLSQVLLPAYVFPDRSFQQCAPR